MSTPENGSFVWYDLLTTDPAAAVTFYGHVIGWESQTLGPEYTMFANAQGPLAGATKLPERARTHGAPPHWTSNVKVADVDATVAEATKLGGRVLTEPSDYPNVGRLAVIADPQGAVINVFTPKQPLHERDRSKPGELTWSELLAADHEAAFRFYAALFGWKKKRDFDIGPLGQYLVFGVGDHEVGGIFTKPKHLPAPPHWLYYVQVADLEAAIGGAKAKGGKLVNGPMEVPGGARIAQLDDPQGAGFALHENANPSAKRA
jgi:predicted enzyme related to lactoylglutathione lyase